MPRSWPTKWASAVVDVDPAVAEVADQQVTGEVAEAGGAIAMPHGAFSGPRLAIAGGAVRPPWVNVDEAQAAAGASSSEPASCLAYAT